MIILPARHTPCPTCGILIAWHHYQGTVITARPCGHALLNTDGTVTAGGKLKRPRLHFLAREIAAKLPPYLLQSAYLLTLPNMVTHARKHTGHWCTHYRQTRPQRLAAYTALREAFPGYRLSLPLTFRLTRIAHRRLDEGDNLRIALSACRDGLGDALGLRNDETPGLTWEYDQEKAPKGQKPCVQVLIIPGKE